ncbi:MAG: DUF2079 domain-containing protein [Spirochaetia bacterium]|nr:DUF2079 domain-containing protein [Spirochaetia bacterium]
MIPFIAGVPAGLFLAAFLAGHLMPSGGQSLVAGLERLLALILLAFSAYFFYRKRDASDSQTGALLWRYVPLLCAAAYFAYYSTTAYDALFLGDSDFTNMSEAVRSAASFEGWFRTPYLSTGPSGSYLGHHFAPGLLLFVPFYWVAYAGEALGIFRATHAVYGVGLWFYFTLGMILWSVVIQRRVNHSLGTAILTLMLVSNVILQRMVQSFHFEIVVLPVSALVFLFEKRNRPTYFAMIVLWLTVKEDMAAYIACLGLFQITSKASRRQGAVTLSLAVVWAVAAFFLMRKMGGTSTPDWTGYWRDMWGTARSLRPAFDVLLFFGLAPLLVPRRFLLMILPVLALHVLSLHPWHRSFHGHYGYALLPFLLIASIEGVRRVFDTSVLENETKWFGGRASALVMLIGAVALYGASVDRETPGLAFQRDPRRAEVRAILAAAPPGVCVAAHIPFSGHVPLDTRVFPLFAQPGNALGAVMNPSARGTVRGLEAGCSKGRLWIYDMRDPKPPYYDSAGLARLDKELRHLKRCPEAVTLSCYFEPGVE